MFAKNAQKFDVMPLVQLIQHPKPLCPFLYLAILTLDQTFRPEPVRLSEFPKTGK